MDSLICTGICFAICFSSIMLISVSKFVIKVIYNKRQRYLDVKKFEYPFALFGFAMTFTGIFCYLCFGLGETDYNAILKLSTSYALTQQSLYVFFGQAFRKGTIWTIKKIYRIIFRTKHSKRPVEDLPNIINSEINPNFNNEINSTFESGNSIMGYKN